MNEKHIAETTQDEIIRQTIASLLLVFVNVLIFSGIFAYLESWSYGRGFYFVYCSFMTIGYGDQVLHNYVSRSIFIWYIFFAIGSSTYFFAMLSELAFEQWTVQTDHIKKRVERYETKARLKKLYKKGPTDTKNKPKPSKSSLKGKEVLPQNDMEDSVDEIIVQNVSASELENGSESKSHSRDDSFSLSSSESDSDDDDDDAEGAFPKVYSVSVSRSLAEPLSPIIRRKAAFADEEMPLLRPKRD